MKFKVGDILLEKEKSILDWEYRIGHVVEVLNEHYIIYYPRKGYTNGKEDHREIEREYYKDVSTLRRKTLQDLLK